MGTTDGFDEFWGDDAGWSPSHDDARPAAAAPREHGASPDAPRSSRRDIGSDITGRIARIFDPSEAAGRRSHGDRNDPQWTQEIPVVDADATPVDDRPDPLASGNATPVDDSFDDPAFDDVDVWATTVLPEQRRTTADDPPAQDIEHDDEWNLAAWDVQPVAKRRRSGVDPLLVKLGVLAVVVTLAAPLLLSLRSGSGDSTLETSAETTPAPPTPTTIAIELDSEPQSTEAPAPSASPAPAPAAQEPAVDVARPEEPSPTTAADTEASAGSAQATTRRNDAAGTAEQVCAIDYEVVAGDYWLRLADAAGVPIDELLEANAASRDTPLFPGATICLPAGSSTPAAPTTAPPQTTAPDATEPPSTTAAPPTTATTAAPTTTAAPEPPAPPSDSPGPNASPEQVKQIIRDIWPDELEERAIEIAWRESRWIPTADNGHCCLGVFQIYWTVHRGWLGEVGITERSQLFDPLLNTRAAYVLYQRAGGWGPWGF